jgi:1-deoxy-D-xylulose-5-phosphate synthase
MQAIAIGTGQVVRSGGSEAKPLAAGKKVALLAFGSMLAPALQAAEQLDATVANMRFIKPLDTALIKQLAATHDLIVTIEENALMGGAGSAVMEAMQTMNIHLPVLCLGLPDHFIEHGQHETMLADCGLDAVGIIIAIEQKLT